MNGTSCGDAIAVSGTVVEEIAEMSRSLNGRLFDLTQRLEKVLDRSRGPLLEGDETATCAPCAAGSVYTLRQIVGYGHDHAMKLENQMSELERLV